ncbi:hypothetical protein TWF703_009287 [Orbilia oligospora]|uniref:DUF1275 domain protein n=1 Tax=Orbilia oligospora TaxID=2813651 RepID=A0A7C8NL68_ORBOL|nr:hypothetical protein TWF703_009287 [Orbilia oligospora]
MTDPESKDVEEGWTSPSSPDSILNRLRKYNATQIDKSWTSIPVLATSYVSGLTDSAAYNAWSCFISMQTGCFMFGVATIAFCSRKAGATLRGTLVTSFFVQATLIIIAASLVEGKVVPIPGREEQLHASEPTPYYHISLLPLAFLAFQAAGQIVASRSFGHNHIPSIVLTSLYSDLVADPLFFQPVNVKRNERIASAVLVLTGAISGGWIMRESSMAAVLWFAAAIKYAIMVGFIFWPADKKEDGTQ